MGQKYIIDSDTLTNIADAIRIKKGTTAKIKVSELDSEIIWLSCIEYFSSYTPGKEETNIDLTESLLIYADIYIEFSEDYPATNERVWIGFQGRDGSYQMEPSIQALEEYGIQIMYSRGPGTLYVSYGPYGVKSYHIGDIDCIDITFEDASSDNSIVCDFSLVRR